MNSSIRVDQLETFALIVGSGGFCVAERGISSSVMSQTMATL
jgi:hypothetical protein